MIVSVILDSKKTTDNIFIKEQITKFLPKSFYHTLLFLMVLVH